MEFAEPAPAPAGGRPPQISRSTLDRLAEQARVPAAEGVRQLRGVVRSGVERNSWVLLGPQGELLAQLVGGPRGLRTDGRAVVVTGVFLTDLHTTAQQGAPFRVQTAEPDAAPS